MSLRFDILSPIGGLAGNAPIGDAKTNVAVFVNSAHGQFDRQLSARKPISACLMLLKTLNRLPWLRHEYALVIVELQQGPGRPR